MEKQIEKAPILITGVPRSMTSATAGVINICGAFGGEMSGPNKNNQKGMYENAKIRNTVVKPYLKQLGVDPKGQYPLPDINTLPIPNDWRKRVEDVFLEQGYKGGPWFYKGAKMALMWPAWHYAFPNATWIIVRRKDEDIINSCMKTGFMNAFNTREDWQWYVYYHKERFVEMVMNGLNVRQVWPSKMVYGDYQEMQETIQWLGLRWKPDKVYNFISPKLMHSYKKEGVIK
jgi:hypothetical protein